MIKGPMKIIITHTSDYSEAEIETLFYKSLWEIQARLDVITNRPLFLL